MLWTPLRSLHDILLGFKKWSEKKKKTDESKFFRWKKALNSARQLPAPSQQEAD